jgi:hypothetical protein
MARHLPNQRTMFLSRLGRLEAHLVKDSEFDDQVKSALPEVWLPFVHDDTPIILDLSDIAKPLAKKMDYLATIRDGSTSELVNGYWLVELYASLSRNNPVPVLLEPFSHQEPYSPGQNPVVLDAIHKIFELTENLGVLVVDLVFDAGVFFEDWLDNKYRLVARLVGKRHLLRFSGDFGDSNEGQWIPTQARQIVDAHPNICDRSVLLSQPLADKPHFLMWRLQTRPTQAIKGRFRLHKDLPWKLMRRYRSLSLLKKH